MKINGFLFLSFIFGIAMNFGCSKTDDISAGIISSSPVSTDPAVNILGRWQVLKDSIVAVNFAFASGEVPVSGVYRGRSVDNWNFKENGTVLIYQGALVGAIDYLLPVGNNLLMPAFEWGDVTILTLNRFNLIWEKSITSSNGGTYYRKAYLRR
jgi:hypothetical protein